MRTNLLTKQLIISILLGFIPYSIMNYMLSSYITNAAKKEMILATSFHVQSVSQALETTISNFEDMTQWIIGNDEIRLFLTLPANATRVQYNHAYSRATSQMYLLPFSAKPYAIISIFRMDGQQLTSGSHSHTQQYLTETERSTAIIRRGGWFWSAENNQLAVCRLVRDETDLSNHLGFIKLLFDPDELLDNLTIGKSSENEFIALLREDGSLLFSNFPEEISHLLEPRNPSLLLSEISNSNMYSISNKQYSLAHQEITGKQVSVVCLREINISLGTNQQSVILIFSILTACTIVSLQIYLINRWIIKPLSKLGNLMQSISKEDYSVRFHVRGRDEIAEVGNRFNEMCMKLQSLYETVYQINLKACEAEILALQAEINPHFMFNTLDNIYWMIHIGKSEQAMAMIKALSESFRITLYKTKDGFVTLRLAIEHVENYLFIQKMRLQNNLQYCIEVDNSIDQDLTMVLHLVLQPIVENAIQHGITVEGQGEVIIMIYLQDQALYYNIYDSGRNADQEVINRALHEPPEGSHGLALYNINSRIRLKFGSDYGLSFNKPEDTGSVFLVKQPYIKREGGHKS